MTGPALLSARGVTLCYGQTEILSNVDVRLHAGDDVALLGRSGSGKTSLLLGLAGLLPLARGMVERHGLSKHDVAMVFQSPSLLPELSAIENVALPLRLTGAADADEAKDRAACALRSLDVTSFDALPGHLSGGQLQRVAVARVLATGARVVLADEPTGALDPRTGALVIAALRDHRDNVNGALLVATHDLTVAGALRTRLTLDDGLLAAEAS
jgi:ABC-type lipoprotein export system ATPase subunit